MRLRENMEFIEFAEIEYECGEALENPAPPAQPIAKRDIDPIREKFYKMRGLAAGNPFTRDDAALFYEQAKFMENFSDDYGGFSDFSMYYPCYQRMGYEQLRTYFTWRAKARGGDMMRAPIAYVFLHIYELISNIGVKDPADGAEKLMAVWGAYKEYEPVLDKYLPDWIKDYHIYYELPYSFIDFVCGRGLRGYYPELFIFGEGAAGSLEMWNSLSSYDITESAFCAGGNRDVISGCFDYVLAGVRELCAERGVRIGDLFSSGAGAVFRWYPFQRALFCGAGARRDRTVELPGGEVYSCKDNRWTANVIINETKTKELIGYLLKKTEACLRAAFKYKYKMTVNPGIIAYDFQRKGVPIEQFDDAVNKAVLRFHRDLTRITVTVEPGSLAKIREEALSTQGKLSVPEDGPPASSAAMQADRPVSPRDGWTGLKAALSYDEREALKSALQGGGVISFASEKAMMPEVLLDGINEKAFDFIGDNILDECGMAVYDEYVERVREMLG